MKKYRTSKFGSGSLPVADMVVDGLTASDVLLKWAGTTDGNIHACNVDDDSDRANGYVHNGNVYITNK